MASVYVNEADMARLERDVWRSDPLGDPYPLDHPSLGTALGLPPDPSLWSEEDWARAEQFAEYGNGPSGHTTSAMSASGSNPTLAADMLVGASDAGTDLGVSSNLDPMSEEFPAFLNTYSWQANGEAGDTTAAMSPLGSHAINSNDVPLDGPSQGFDPNQPEDLGEPSFEGLGAFPAAIPPQGNGEAIDTSVTTNASGSGTPSSSDEPSAAVSPDTNHAMAGNLVAAGHAQLAASVGTPLPQGNGQASDNTIQFFLAMPEHGGVINHTSHPAYGSLLAANSGEVPMPPVADPAQPEGPDYGCISEPTFISDVVRPYHQGLANVKKAKALIDHRLWERIRTVLESPSNTKNETAQFRHWVKQAFTLENSSTQTGESYQWIADRKSKKPVACLDYMYALIRNAHRRCMHSGRDKTDRLVREQWCGIPKVLVAEFIQKCPTCNNKRRAAKESARSKGKGKGKAKAEAEAETEA